jgi:hypothetical protein
MQWSDISFAPSTRTLRQFAATALVFLGGLAAWQGWMHQRTELAIALAVLAATVGVLGLVKPAAIRPVYVGCMILTFPIGWIVSRLLLAVVFYGIFTPLGLLFRLLGRDALGIRPQPEAPSYWLPKPAVTDRRRYFRQF